jgi:hypothetical protein
VQTTGNTLGLKIGNADQSNGAIERSHSYVPGRWVTVARIRTARSLARLIWTVLTGSGTHPIFTTEPVYAAATLDLRTVHRLTCASSIQLYYVSEE